ncbi:MAG: D-alanyl-D-alanine carboxypeptidase family protein [Candidatus Saccharibacteria bacterium]|nr:D-alanyl-D-alanine carboxypeptidase family protein [Candidatus Saccharibacteria bacterium]
MIITQRKRRPVKATLVTLAALTALVGGGVLAYMLLSPRKVDPPALRAQAEAPQPSPTQADTPAPRIKLNDSVSVAPLPGDYTADDHLWRLVNKTTPLKNTKYRPADLQLATVSSRQDKSRDERSVRADIMPQVEALFTGAKAAGHQLQIGSAFRGYELQNTYYSNYTRLYGQAAADKVSARPGYSEHQTGLVMDLATPDRQCYLETCFGDTPAGRWLAAHAHEYGFIISYPKGKEAITGYQYEPWHVRYVGKELASALKQANLTLDEATPLLLKGPTR